MDDTEDDTERKGSLGGGQTAETGKIKNWRRSIERELMRIRNQTDEDGESIKVERETDK